MSKQDEMIVLAVNKPKGIVCTEDQRERDSIVRFLNYPVRVTYAGRLDKDSRGLLLMTNNGDIINQMMRQTAMKKNIKLRLIKRSRNNL